MMGTEKPRRTSPRQELPQQVAMAGAMTCSPVLQPLLCVLQASLQVPDADLLLLQGSQVLLRRRWLYPMVVTAQVVLGRAPAGTQMSPTASARVSTGLTQGF